MPIWLTRLTKLSRLHLTYKARPATTDANLILTMLTLQQRYCRIGLKAIKQVKHKQQLTHGWNQQEQLYGRIFGIKI